MHSVILSTATRYMLPLIVLFSVFLLLRGHHEPGGGFVGGLVAAASFVLFAIAHDSHMARRALRIEPRLLIALGLSLAAFSGVPALLLGKPFMTGLWITEKIPVIGRLGTPLLFDIGVYLLVLGVTLTIIFTLIERE